MPNVSRMQPENNFPDQALQETIQKFPDQANTSPNLFDGSLTFMLASAADAISPWGRSVALRDMQLRDFWPTETYLAGAVANVCFRNAAFRWEIHGPTSIETAVTDMLTSAISGDTFGWVTFIEKLSQDLYTQDNGSFIELIRDPGMDANSAFKAENAPVIGIAHLDASSCVRTGNPGYPVVYRDREGGIHKLKWYEVIAMSDFPSAIEKMNGVGYCPVTRALRLAQLLRSIEIYKDEKIGGRLYKSIHIVGGVSRTDIDDAKKRGREEADNFGHIRYIDPVILASLDPEKPVSVATLDLASLPDGFDLGKEMEWYIAGLALSFGVDYQEFAPLPGRNLGSGGQSAIMDKKSSGKGPAVFMRTISEAFKNSGVLPRNTTLEFDDNRQWEELEKQEIRTKAMEEMTMAARAGILNPDSIRKILVNRGIYTEAEVKDIPADYGLDILVPTKAPIGQIGGNTARADAGRTDKGQIDPTKGGQLLKEIQ